MQGNNEDSSESQKEGNDVIEEKKYFINETEFQMLKKCQQAIYEATEISPSLRKIVNQLITEENLQKIKSKFIETWRN